MQKNNSKSTMRRILILIKPYRLRMCLGILLAIVVVITTLLLPILAGKAVDTILGKDHVNFEKLAKIIIQMILAMVVTSVAQWLMSAINNSVVYRMIRDIRMQAFDKLQRLPISYIDGNSHGDIISRIINDVDQFSDGLLLGFSQLLTGVLTILLTLVFMFSVSIRITLVVILVTPLSMFVAAFIAKKSYVHFKNQSTRRGEMTGIVDEMVGGISTIKAFGVEEMALDSFEQADENLRDAYVKATFFSSISNPATRFVNALVYAGVGITGAFLAISGYISVGQLASVLSYAQQYTKPFNDISGVVTELQNSIACAARVFALIDESEIVADPENAVELKNVEGNVKLENVEFSYVPDKKFIDNLNIDVKKGQRVAFVGPTGCGKTTVINLLMRFYEITGGRIRVEGISTKEVTRDSLVKSFGMVLQDTWLKSGTIRENIAMGKPDASMEEIVAAAKEAYADGFIRRLPNGYDTVITEGGENFSAGQRQLLCIARVMLCLPPILILDEATSSIDTRTELKIQDAFDKMMQGRTSFIVAHRLSTIRSADVIMVMKDGHIIESGKHEKLLEKKGFYANLYNSQFA
ncbi:MAG: ABC transporter ATP-binding protein [Lachnospiraceae bacterium]|nr:ABC transporter ATP-binding protein [Lachnospiraceae bacterium]